MGIIQYSEESLKFQSDKLFKHLTMLFEEILKIKDKSARADSPLWRAMEETIFDFTGIQTTIMMDVYGPAVELPSVDRNNILINAWRRPYMSSSDGIKMIHDAGKNAIGFTNPNDGTIGGVFSKVNHKVHMNEGLFDGSESIKFTPEEFSGIMIHELGHIWTFYNYLGNVATTNHVLQGMAIALANEGDFKQREKILKLAADELKLKDLDTASLAKSSDQRVIEHVFISSAIRETRSELGTPYYDLSQAEQLADEYAARFQAHVALVTALDKIERNRTFNISYRSWPMYFLLEAVKIVGVIGSVLINAISIVSPWVHVAANVTRTFLLLLIAADGRGDGEYDRPGARFKRIRSNIVEQLKNKNLSKDQITQLREDILEIDSLVKMVEDKDQVVSILWDFLSPSSRRDQAQIKLQRHLEDIANNEVFVHSAALRQLA